MKKLFIIFGLIFIVFAGVVIFQFRGNQNAKNESATVKVNNQTFKVGIADTPEELQRGLSGRNSLPKDQGMLFIYKNKDYHSFWMKDMKFPIDIIFIDGNKIISIAKNAPIPLPNQTGLPIFRSGGPNDKVFEINAGLSDKYNIKVGDKVEINLPKK